MQEDITPIGITNYRNTKLKFGIKDADMHQHIFLTGKTGVGKSTLIRNMALSEINRGKGIAFIDPHADLAQELVSNIPTLRKQDLIYFNPADKENTVRFNPLHNVPETQHHIVASGLVATFKKIWSESWGVRMEYILRYALLTLLAYPKPTLLDIHTLLTKREFREHVLLYVKNEHIISFWKDEFDTYTPRFKTEVIAPILNKLGVFKVHEPLQRLVQADTNSLDFKDIMDNRKILICNLSKGGLSEDVTAILGGMLLSSVQNTSLARSNIPISKRVSFTLYCEESPTYLNTTALSLLSESRKYFLGCVLVAQYLEQFDEPIRQAIFGNVGTIISFRVGATDARYLEKEFYPIFEAKDFVYLPRYHIYLKLMIDGSTSQPFSAVTLPPL